MNTIEKPQTITTLDGAQEEIFPVACEEEILFDLLEDIFSNYWQQIRFGTLTQGAAWEVGAPNAPTKISLLDGYLTVDFGPWHFHVCIGENNGTRQAPTSEELKKLRKCSRAEFYRRLNQDGNPSSWGFRSFNGAGENQITVFFPNPYYDLFPKFKRHKNPKWEKLDMWNTLRNKHLGLEEDPKDTQGAFKACTS
ncbi:hypothetical protein GCM10009122_17330 [Fulvivirga kasyanovii]|uniref:Uncharacterized protein n=1 Tax=Fulvivirga kasyanovii TaxID=396812 RepID=A0ABW9RT76_9BACT|nr:hypothetical protein [Fulvivirga kasyanovii]MTI26493.1 hypothetical protein [Fulvivirga kasyanovii]